jgi:hypothetical protein
MEFTPKEVSPASKYIEPLTAREAFEASHLLRIEDRRELEGSGHHPMICLPHSVFLSTNPIKFFNRDREVSGFAGVVDEGDGIGRVWMLCTPAVEKIPFLFVKEAKRWLASQPYTMLHNVADPRNYMHLKLLHLLGFNRLSYVAVGPKLLTYVEFAKLCALPQ